MKDTEETVEIPVELLNRAILGLFNAYPRSRLAIELKMYMPDAKRGPR